jgi:hypothetical protein
MTVIGVFTKPSKIVGTIKANNAEEKEYWNKGNER